LTDPVSSTVGPAVKAQQSGLEQVNAARLPSVSIESAEKRPDAAINLIRKGNVLA
jgi:hypothetical protein